MRPLLRGKLDGTDNQLQYGSLPRQPPQKLARKMQAHQDRLANSPGLPIKLNRIQSCTPSFLGSQGHLDTDRRNSSLTAALSTYTTTFVHLVQMKRLSSGRRARRYCTLFHSYRLHAAFVAAFVECALPPTFQSWFTITNLHVWLLTVRLRALPVPHGMQHIQGLIDHFFQDVEERVRYVLQPGVLPPRSPSTSTLNPGPNSTTPSHTLADDASYVSPYLSSQFYTPPSSVPPPQTFPSVAAYSKAQKRGRAPERVVVRQMQILKEQWAGLGMSMDLGLVRGDTELAASVWRNLLGARGAAGVGLPSANHMKGDIPDGGFRRSVNLVGGMVDRVDKLDVDAEEAKDDQSGVHDFPLHESDRYIPYPELMSTLVTYIRREARRMENAPDSLVLGPRVVGKEGEGVKNLGWGAIRQ
ncbi:hypothetical protein ID866_1698 [Astraeus odoratus]|nr:hypothetical protein ID866_1698 [Astraeus odoratus]